MQEWISRDRNGTVLCKTVNVRTVRMYRYRSAEKSVRYRTVRNVTVCYVTVTYGTVELSSEMILTFFSKNNIIHSLGLRRTVYQDAPVQL